jgi:HTH-type transcriptional regulator, sugar sensing transcriptional regulator
MIINKLQKLGLSEKEAKVYLATLELGETNINRIATKSKISRTTTYDVINSLKNMGLVSSTIINKKKYYSATDPNFFNDKIDQEKNTLETILPELLSVSNLIDKKPKIKFYEGIEGIKEIYLDTLKYPNTPLYAWVTDKVFGVFEDEFINFYLKKRVDKKILAYVIAPNKEIIGKYQSLDKINLRQTKIDSDPDFYVGIEIDLYGGRKIGIMAFEEKIGLLIESEKIFKALKSIFDISWKRIS